MAKRPSILIAVFSMGDVRSDMSDFLIRCCTRQEYDVGYFVVQGKIPHDSARNYAVKHFMEQSKADFLLMVDSDIMPPGAEVLEMCRWNLPVVSAMCLVLGANDIVTTASRLIDMEDGTRHHVAVDVSKETANPVPIEFVGAGCIMIRRDVLSTIRGRKVIPFAFDYDEDGIMWQGEDYHFCQVARDNGFPVYLDRRFLCDHTKRVSLNTINRIVYNHYRKRTPGILSTSEDGSRDSHSGSDAGESPASSGGAGGQ